MSTEPTTDELTALSKAVAERLGYRVETESLSDVQNQIHVLQARVTMPDGSVGPWNFNPNLLPSFATSWDACAEVVDWLADKLNAHVSIDAYCEGVTVTIIDVATGSNLSECFVSRKCSLAFPLALCRAVVLLPNMKEGK